MPIFTPTEMPFVQALSRLAFCNPFLPERIEYEREALGDEFAPSDLVWSMRPATDPGRRNIDALQRHAEKIAAAARERLVERPRINPTEKQLYEELVLYLLYNRYWQAMTDFISAGGSGKTRVSFYRAFNGDLRYFFDIDGLTFDSMRDAPVVFAVYYQIRRTFLHTFTSIAGGSLAAARLRASIWQSIFTHDIRRYRRALHSRMGEMTTLITGPSGTGKEIVARAIAMSRFIPFDVKTQSFEADFSKAFYALNVSALSPTLVESELFGHRRGSFTGALEDRPGWLEICPALGTVFLDEVGEIDPQIQVKLLRVLQTREFQRLGDTETRQFRGKIIAATNRDLPTEMAKGEFRRDFYYRLCADMIVTPSLQEQLRESPGELDSLVQYIAGQVAGEEEAGPIADEVVDWIGSHLGRTYPWPGNFRELEQCVRNVLIRRAYYPAVQVAPSTDQKLSSDLLAGRLTVDELLGRYCRLVYEQTGSYEETARRLGIDRRTVKAKIIGHDSAGDTKNAVITIQAP